MIGLPPSTRVWLVAGVTDMRKGFDGLATLVQQQLGKDPFGGQLFCFRGRRSHLLKILWWDGQGLVLYAKRLDRGRFIWPQAKDGAVALTPAQLAMLAEGIDTLVLGCTHFPMLAGAIRAAVGPNIRIVDSAATTAKSVRELLARENLTRREGAGTTRFLATDSVERFARIGSRFLERPIDPEEVELVDL